MTQIDVIDLIRTNGSLFLQCPNCCSHHLDCPEIPRGDDAVECLTCGQWYSYAELEDRALDGTRKLLSLDFPELSIGHP